MLKCEAYGPDGAYRYAIYGTSLPTGRDRDRFAIEIERGTGAKIYTDRNGFILRYVEVDERPPHIRNSDGSVRIGDRLIPFDSPVFESELRKLGLEP
jgi:hypothetical protein